LEFTFNFSPKAGVELPDSYEATDLSDLDRYNGVILRAKSTVRNNQGLSFTSYKKRPTLELKQMANNME